MTYDKAKAAAALRVYSGKTVYEAALDRIRWLFDEFPEVVVSISGGKDSDVVYNLALAVAREKGRLPLKVVFLDQEAEYQCVVDHVRECMTDPDVEPHWYQVPFRLFNAASHSEHWLVPWDPSAQDRWMRDREPFAVTENRTGEERFHEMFPGILRLIAPDTKACFLAGMRAEESPTRRMTLTTHAKYKWVTWARALDKRRQHFTFYPIYDWGLSDVWKAMLDNGWRYSRYYDLAYRVGIPIRKIRVSSVCHETSVQELFVLQEIEPQTWSRLTARMAGVDMVSKLGRDDFFANTGSLPFAFGSWREYRDYLLEHLIDRDDWKAAFRKRFALMDTRYPPSDALYRVQVSSILTNDWEGVKLSNWEWAPDQYIARTGQTREKPR